ncbi:hypothetical protein HYPSUDRAFT_1014314 [Hypholoma sublateritium FD-334 SS-4]|uniref:Zinc finger C2H2 LYAR-type domain-containing protein n=1 Tax=Hypholoma sublateritium (strain FD-334 SS-4) TaxID=945553 RepID=A0A0D2M2Y5_HYPSF|nr:hypothetical protein HYPSUDRAFT_1014314 [Hypholoma sublateritium FD-334 SS-4]
MVSFQCHACGDVVKKPKLDQHRMRCHSGYDCIDCSTTFNTPADYKGHTSCISEAEKYQKGLYKGPKTGEAKAQTTAAPKAAATKTAAPQLKEKKAEVVEPVVAARASNAQWKPAPQKEQWGVWGRGGGVRMTGANETPLGANNRPDPTPPPAVPVASPTPAKANGARKESKQKLMAAEVIALPNKKDKISTEKNVAGPSTEVIEVPKKDKKSKKTEQVVEEVSAQTEKVRKEKKDKRDKKEKQKEEVAESNEEVKTDKKVKKRKRVEEDDPMTGEAAVEAGEEKKKKKKKEKKDNSTTDAMDVETTPSNESLKKKEKKAKKEKTRSSSSS